MNRSRRHKILLVLALLTLLVGLPTGLIYREYKQKRLDQDLLDAVSCQDTSRIATLLEQGADPNARDIPDAPRTFWQILRQTIERFRHHPTTQELGVTALYNVFDVWFYDWQDKSTCQQIEADARLLIEHGADVRTPTELNKEILSTAAIWGKPSVLKLLLDHGADPNGWSNHDKETDKPSPLYEAAGARNIQNVRLLLKYKVRVNGPERQGNSILADMEEEAGRYYVRTSKSQSRKVKTIIALLKQAGAKE